MSSYVTFKISDQKFAIEVRRVKEIIPHRDTNKIPHSPKYIEGMIDLRGNIISVIDPKAALGIFCDGPATHIMVLELQECMAGLTINALGEIVEIDDSELYDLTYLFGNNYDPKVERMISCIGKDGDDLYRVIDANNVSKMLD